jgi:hypothetical protein
VVAEFFRERDFYPDSRLDSTARHGWEGVPPPVWRR